MGFRDKKNKNEGMNQIANINPLFELNNKQCSRLEDVIKKIGEEKFLIERGVISVTPQGWSVLQYEGLANNPIKAAFGIRYWSDIPYDFWSRALDQMKRYINKRTYAERMEVFRITGEMPLIEGIRIVRESLPSLFKVQEKVKTPEEAVMELLPVSNEDIPF